MKSIFIGFFIMFFCSTWCYGGYEKKYVFIPKKVEVEIAKKDATYGSVNKLLKGIEVDEKGLSEMRAWFKQWLLKQDKINWNATKAIVENGGLEVIDDEILYKYFAVSCFNGVNDDGWDKLIDYVTPYFDDRFHFRLSVQLAQIDDRDVTICVLGKLAKYTDFSIIKTYKERAIAYEAKNMKSVLDELEIEINKIKK